MALPAFENTSFCFLDENDSPRAADNFLANALGPWLQS